MPGFYKPEDRYAGKLIALGTRDEQGQAVNEDYIVDGISTDLGTLTINYDTIDVGTSSGRPAAFIRLVNSGFIVIWLPHTTPEVFVSYATKDGNGNYTYVAAGDAVPAAWLEEYKGWVSLGTRPAQPTSFVRNVYYDILGETTRSVQNKLRDTLSFRSTVGGR